MRLFGGSACHHGCVGGRPLEERRGGRVRALPALGAEPGRRDESEGEAAFEPRSRRPHTVPSRTAAALEDDIVEMRKGLLDLGLDAGAATIAYHLAEPW